MDIGKIFEKVVKKLKVENSLQKTLKVNEKTLLTGDNSPFDSVAFVQFTSYIELEISKKNKKNFSIMLFEIPEVKKNKPLTIGNFKKYLRGKI
tara:strand:- start:1237 stop:1515 length:279 start_codon:yes stop_codon:yes gene_type:complete